MKKLILASNSPRRQELLKGLDLPFSVDTLTSFEESAEPGVEAHKLPSDMALGKSLGFHRELDEDEILVTADTVVIIDGEPLGKPHSREQAVSMLRTLSGRTHEVVTAVVIRTREELREFSDSTMVTFCDIPEDEICTYVDRYKPYDKAGAYGVQEWIGYVGISRLEGSFYNVMGFPVHKVWAELRELL